MKTLSLFGTLIIVIGGFIGCAREEDDARILKDINSTSVHLTVGLKYLIANPKHDPEIFAAQEKLEALLLKNELNFTDFTTIAKVALQARSIGAEEVALGRSSDFLFIPTVLNSEKANMTAEQDHAITLVAFYLLQFNPTAPLFISDKSMLYEAWMAGTVDLQSEHLNSLLRAAQTSTFASNEYCDFASEHAAWLRQHPLKAVDKKQLNNTIEGLSGLGRAAGHAPQAAPILAALLLAPALVELAPGAARIFAHLETGACLNKIDKKDAALQQQGDALDVLLEMGFPEPELAPLSAAIAYKRGDFKRCADELQKTKDSHLLDARSKRDLQTLAANIDNPDPDLIQRYFTDASLGLFAGKLIHQRLLDSGAYTEIGAALNLERGIDMYQEMNKLDTGAALKKAKGWLN